MDSIAQRIAENPLAKMAERIDFTERMINNQFKGVSDAIGKHNAVMGSITLPHYKVICRRKSGKFIETPNVKSRATMSQAGRIRLMYPGRCNA